MLTTSTEFSGNGVDLCITGFLRIHPTFRALLENQLALHEIMPARIAAYRWTNKQINQLNHPTLHPFILPRSTKERERDSTVPDRKSAAAPSEREIEFGEVALCLFGYWKNFGKLAPFFSSPQFHPDTTHNRTTPQRCSANNLWA